MASGGWKVGELARATGLTVRTLHHYDQIGLLKPSKRTEKGHRVYGDADVARLQQVTSLRQLGFPLEQIRDLLDRRGVSPREVIALHLRRLREEIDAQHRLVRRLESISTALERAETVSAGDLILTIEATTMYDRYFTPGQRDELNARAAALGDDQMRAVEDEWPRLMADVRTEMDAGTDPADPRVQRLAARWMELVHAFTGGNPGIERSVRSMWQQESSIHGIETAPARELMAYVQRAIAAGKTGGG